MPADEVKGTGEAEETPQPAQKATNTRGGQAKAGEQEKADGREEPGGESAVPGNATSGSSWNRRTDFDKKEFVRVVGDALIMRRINEQELHNTTDRFPSDRTISQSDYVAGAFLEEAILRAASRSAARAQSPGQSPMEIRGTFQRKTGSSDLDLDSLKGPSPLPIETVIASRRTFSHDAGSDSTDLPEPQRDKENLGIASSGPTTVRNKVPTRGVPKAVLVDVSWYGFGIGSTHSFKELVGISGHKPFSVVIKAKDRAATQSSAADVELSQALKAFLQEFRHVSFVVVSAEELRGSDRFVSFQVSWERTVQTAIEALVQIEPDSNLGYLTEAEHVVITFGPEAALYVQLASKGPPPPTVPLGKRPDVSSATFVFEPSSIEDDIVRAHPGRMSGFDTCVACSITHQLAHFNPLAIKGRSLRETMTSAIVRGLKAARFLQAHGLQRISRTGDAWDPFLPDMLADRSPAIQCQEYADACGAAEEEQWVFPTDYVGELLATGSIRYYQWYPKEVTEELSKFDRHYRSLRRAWQAVGWLAVHHIEPETFASIPLPNSAISQGAGSRRAHFDETWWSFLAMTCFDSAMLADLQDDRAKAILRNSGGRPDAILGNSLRKVNPIKHQYLDGRGGPASELAHIYRALAIEVLTHGPHWLVARDWKVAARRERCLARLFERYPAAVPRGAKLLRAEQVDNCNPGRDPTPSEDEPTILDSIAECLSEEPFQFTNFKPFPMLTIGDVWTVDRREIESLRNVSSVLQGYIDGASVTKPLSIGVFGQPGSGKSMAVKEIVAMLQGRGPTMVPLTFNLSQFSKPEQLTEAFNEIQDMGLKRIMPVVFWDEFDAALDGLPLGWLKYFIGPMNDGEYFDANRTRGLPKCVFVFAAGSLPSFAVVEELSQGNDSERVTIKSDMFLAAKGPDFKSRLAAVIDILGVNRPESLGGGKNLGELPSEIYGYMFRRVAVLRYNFKRFYPKLFTKDLLHIDPRVAEAFLGVERYEHGARSIEKIVQTSSAAGRGIFDVSCLPPASLLRLHVDQREFESYYVGIEDLGP